MPGRRRRIEIDATSQVTVNPIQPYQAVKEYICPGCDNTIPAGTFHLVVIPDDAVDMRRHWHHGCWHKELRRIHGRMGTPASGVSGVPPRKTPPRETEPDHRPSGENRKLVP